jgi:anti-sigma-K factor RskA
MTITPDIHTLTGPYVLDAVDDLERTGFEQHLSVCVPCGAEVRGLRESLVKLTAGIAMTPPASLKPAVLAQAATLRQLPPRLRVPAGTASSTERKRPRIALRSLVALAAAFLAAATGGGIAIDQYRDNTAAAAISASANAILSQPDARTFHGAVAAGGQATIVVSGKQDAGALLVRDLRPLPGNKTYQLWLIDSTSTAHSAGLTNGKSTTPTIITGGLADKIAFAVTVEPKGGSTQPTVPTGGLQPLVPLNQNQT